METSWRKLKWWGWESLTPTGHLCWHAPSGQGPPVPSAGDKVHRGQRSSCIIRSEDLWDRGPGTGLRVGGGGPGSSPSIRGGRQGPGSPGRSHPARPRPCGRVRVRAPRLVPGPCRLHPALCLRALPPTLALSLEGSTAPALPREGLTCRPSWSRSPCLLRGPSSSQGKGPSVGKGAESGGAKSTDPGARWLGSESQLCDFAQVAWPL